VTALDATEPGPDLSADTVVDDPRREIKHCPECSQRYGPEARFCPFDGAELDSLSWDPASDSLLGTIVDDRYEVCAVLGEGGMGTVYKVRHVSLERMFALKVLRKELAKDADLAARFTQEARSTARIKHPAIVQITDFGRLPDGAPYFVMELLLGQPLSVVLKSRGALPHDLACRLVLKIAEGLAAAHEEGIVHRDLKPENVFLVGRTASAMVPEDVRIVDFGAAKVMGASRVTKTGIVFGTPHYMSPEQANGGVVDHRADIYALGVIMYQLFTGRVPFEADTYMGVLTQHMFVQPVRPSEVSPYAKDLGAIEDVILRALEKKPEARFASMEALAAAVRQAVRVGPGGEVIALRGSASSAPPRGSVMPSAAPPPPMSKGPPAWVLGLAGGAVVAVATLGVMALLQPAHPHEGAAPSTGLAPAVLPPPVASVSPPPPPSVAPTTPASAVSAAISAAPPAQSSAPPPVSAAPPPPKRPVVRPPPPPRPKAPDPEFVDPWKKTTL
jgi:eukaryotic-like serine/threonine-protein kinase